MNDAYGFNNFGEGFYYNLPKRFQMNLTVDLQAPPPFRPGRQWKDG